MNVIRDRNGNTVQHSANLAGIRRYVGKNLIERMAVDQVGQDEGKLCIAFDNGNSFECNFASYVCLCDFVLRWRNVYGAPLWMNGHERGKVSSDHAGLRQGRGS